jgi:hypothetical protein
MPPITAFILDNYDPSKLAGHIELSQHPISWLEKIAEEIIFCPPVFEKGTRSFGLKKEF